MTKPTEGPLVLIADNDAGVNELLQEVLSRSGLRTASVEDGEAALEFMQRVEVALLICDLDMPKLGGEQVLERLGEFESPPPVLVVSGYLDDAMERELTAHAAVRGVFRKPFDVFEFASTAGEIAQSSAAPS